jgi:hypothetical protein
MLGAQLAAIISSRLQMLLGFQYPHIQLKLIHDSDEGCCKLES